MPFLRAGFNARNRKTRIRAITRPAEGLARQAPAELRQFECGDYFWFGQKFLAWGESCRFMTWPGLGLPASVTWSLESSPIP